MKKLSELTNAEAREICRLANESFISFLTNSSGIWDGLGLEIQIHIPNDRVIWIYKDGKVSLHRNNGDWGGSRYEEINGLKITDYLKERGYKFV
jgi:hypothetical protein